MQCHPMQKQDSLYACIFLPTALPVLQDLLLIKDSASRAGTPSASKQTPQVSFIASFVAEATAPKDLVHDCARAQRLSESPDILSMPRFEYRFPVPHRCAS